MEKQDISIGKFVQRHMSQLKVLARLMEHELDSAKGKDIVFDRELAENILDTLDIFIEDVDEENGVETVARTRKTVEAKPNVTRLN